MSEQEVKPNQESWVNKKWRPVMGWTYMVICILDFAIFPIAWSILQAMANGTVTSQWDPLTLKGAGLFHLAMGAVLGIAAFGRTQEKIAGSAVNVTPPLMSATTMVPPMPPALPADPSAVPKGKMKIED